MTQDEACGYQQKLMSQSSRMLNGRRKYDGKENWRD